MLYKLFLLLRQVVFQFLFVPLTLIYGTLVVLTRPFGRSVQHDLIDQYAKISLLSMQYILGIRYSVDGLENIPKDEACIIWSKHQSLWECYLLAVILPRQTWVFKKALLHVPFFGWGLRAIDPIPIDRSGGRSAVEQIIEHGADRLKKGYWIALFPEGTRMPVGKTRKFGRSGAFLAVKTGHKIVPVAHNSGEFWPRGSFIVYPGVVKVVIAEAIEPAGKNPDEITASTKHWMETTMRRISPVYAKKAAFYEARGDQDSMGSLKDSRKT